MADLTKKRKAVDSKVDRNKLYSLTDAMSLVKEVNTTKFNASVDVHVRLGRIGRTSAGWEFAAYRARDDVLMVTATQTLVLVDLGERRACEIPEEYRELIRGLEGKDLEA